MEYFLMWHWWYLPVALIAAGIIQSVFRESQGGWYDFNIFPVIMFVAAIFVTIGHFV